MAAGRSFAATLSKTSRIALAKARTGRLVDHLSALFALNEANKHVIYGSDLARQIPRSHAAHAFQHFQMSMHLFELIRLCALWDSPRKDRESIPTILDLIADETVEDDLAAEAEHVASTIRPAHLTPFRSEEHEAAFRAWREEERVARGRNEGERLRTLFARARGMAEEVRGSHELAAIRAFRDRYIAHNLEAPEPRPDGTTDVLPLRYGFEAKILDASVAVADHLHIALNGSSFDWQGSREIAADNAASLWKSCRFEGITY